MRGIEVISGGRIGILAKVFLLGFMGSGKSTIGRNLARRFSGYSFVDLDSYIQEREGFSVSELFSMVGESGFRDLERRYLDDLISLDGDYVIALGGGTPCFGGVMDLLNSCGITVYLRHSVGQLSDRLLMSPTPRPLIAGKSSAELREYVEQTLEVRECYYCRSHITVDSPSRSDFHSLEQILKLHPRWGV